MMIWRNWKSKIHLKILEHLEYRRISDKFDGKYRSCDIFFPRRQTRSGYQAANDDEEEEEAVADKRTSNVAAGQSELWDN